MAAPGDHRVEQAGRGKRQRGHVAGERPEQVGPDGTHRPASEADGVRRGTHITWTRVGPPASIAAPVPLPTASPRVGLGERGRVVDAVTDHRDGTALSFGTNLPALRRPRAGRGVSKGGAAFVDAGAEATAGESADGGDVVAVGGRGLAAHRRGRECSRGRDAGRADDGRLLQPCLGCGQLVLWQQAEQSGVPVRGGLRRTRGEHQQQVIGQALAVPRHRRPPRPPLAAPVRPHRFLGRYASSARPRPGAGRKEAQQWAARLLRAHSEQASRTLQVLSEVARTSDGAEAETWNNAGRLAPVKRARLQRFAAHPDPRVQDVAEPALTGCTRDMAAILPCLHYSS